MVNTVKYPGRGPIIRYNAARLYAQSRTVDRQMQSIALVKDFQFSFNIQRDSTRSIGYDDVDKRIINRQRPKFSFTYYLSDLDNEKLFRMPVTHEEALVNKTPLFTGLESFDLFFLSAESGHDIKDEDPQNLSACCFINCYLTSYELNVTGPALMEISVSFEADDVSFKKFRAIENYEYIDYDIEDLQFTDRLTFELNPEKDYDISIDAGGWEMSNRIMDFNFSASLPYKTIYDFGQIHHKQAISFPVRSRIAMSAFVNKLLAGSLSNMLCEEKTHSILIAGRKAHCSEGPDDKSGMLFKGMRLASQSYKQSTSRGEYLRAELTFDLDITSKYGVWISQHITKANVFLGGETETQEPPTSDGGEFTLSSLILESFDEEIGGFQPKFLFEEALDMLSALRELNSSL